MMEINEWLNGNIDCVNRRGRLLQACHRTHTPLSCLIGRWLAQMPINWQRRHSGQIAEVNGNRRFSMNVCACVGMSVCRCQYIRVCMCVCFAINHQCQRKIQWNLLSIACILSIWCKFIHEKQWCWTCRLSMRICSLVDDLDAIMVPFRRPFGLRWGAVVCWNGANAAIFPIWWIDNLLSLF